jgi:hypothetical protein
VARIGHDREQVDAKARRQLDALEVVADRVGVAAGLRPETLNCLSFSRLGWAAAGSAAANASRPAVMTRDRKVRMTCFSS